MTDATTHRHDPRGMSQGRTPCRQPEPCRTRLRDEPLPKQRTETAGYQAGPAAHRRPLPPPGEGRQAGRLHHHRQSNSFSCNANKSPQRSMRGSAPIPLRLDNHSYRPDPQPSSSDSVPIPTRSHSATAASRSSPPRTTHLTVSQPRSARTAISPLHHRPDPRFHAPSTTSPQPPLTVSNAPATDVRPRTARPHHEKRYPGRRVRCDPPPAPSSGMVNTSHKGHPSRTRHGASASNAGAATSGHRNTWVNTWT